MESLTIPFSDEYWTDGDDALITVRGVLRTEPDGLVLEFRRKKSDFVHTDREGEIETVHVPWSEVQSLAFKRGLILGGTLTLRTRGLRALEKVPSADGNELEIGVSRADRMTARELAANVQLALAEARLAALDAPAARPRLPHPEKDDTPRSE